MFGSNRNCERSWAFRISTDAAEKFVADFIARTSWGHGNRRPRLVRGSAKAPSLAAELLGNPNTTGGSALRRVGRWGSRTEPPASGTAARALAEVSAGGSIGSTATSPLRILPSAASNQTATGAMNSMMKTMSIPFVEPVVPASCAD